jgi:hypothetical protein
MAATYEKRMRNRRASRETTTYIENDVCNHEPCIPPVVGVVDVKAGSKELREEFESKEAPIETERDKPCLSWP